MSSSHWNDDCGLWRRAARRAEAWTAETPNFVHEGQLIGLAKWRAAYTATMAAVPSAAAAISDGSAKLPVRSSRNLAAIGPAICPTPNPAVINANERRCRSGARARGGKAQGGDPHKVAPSSSTAIIAPAGVGHSPPTATVEAGRVGHGSAVGAVRALALRAHHGAARRWRERAAAGNAQGGERGCGAPSLGQDPGG